MSDRLSMNSAELARLRPPVSDALISVVLPVYNEAEVLDELCAQLRTALTDCRTTYEIIFVDDGSQAGCADRLDDLAQRHSEVRVVHLSRNFGHQAALHAGLAQAQGDAIVLMDSDLQDPPEAIGKFLEAWQAGYDVAYAIRSRRPEGATKRLMFATFHRLLASISKTPIPADAGNFGLIDARVAQAVLAMNERDRYLPGLRGWVGFKQIGIPVERGARYDRRPRVSLFGLLRLAKTAIFSFSSLPLAIFSWIGCVALLLFLGVSGYSLYCRLFTDWAVPGWTSQLVTMSFFAALNALGISMLGEYVVRIYDQVRARPMYLVDRIVNAASAENTSTANADEEMQLPKLPDPLGLEDLDPLELNSQWSDAYNHLLDQVSDLLDLGTLATSEADDVADRRQHKSFKHEPLANFTVEADREISAESEAAINRSSLETPDDVPAVLSFSDRRGK